MPVADASRSSGSWIRGGIAATLVLLLAVAAVPSPAEAAPPPLPIAYGAVLLSNLSAPTLAPGSSGTLTFQVADPASFEFITAVTLTLEVYAFNAYPGNANSTLSSTGVPLLVTPTASGTRVNLSLASLTKGSVEAGSVGVATSDSTPAGDFAVRTALSFLANGTEYLLESRGWFTASEWAAATQLPGGATTLNLTVLGVSGVTPETAIQVSSSSWDWALTLILGASIVLVGAAAFVYFRRGPKSSSGAR